jgi:hypothetical protein
VPRHHRRAPDRSRNRRRSYLWPVFPALLRILVHVAEDPHGSLDLAVAALARLGGWVL